MKPSARIILIFVAFTTIMFGYTLKWNIPPGKRLEAVKNANVSYYMNTQLIESHSERNIVDFTSYKREKNGHKTRGTFSFFDRVGNTYQLQKTFNSDFFIADTGRMYVPRTNLVPNVRHIPSFPTRDLKVGESWRLPAEEVILINYKYLTKLLVMVDYTLEQEIKIGGTNIAVLTYYYTIDKENSRQLGDKGTPEYTGPNKSDIDMPQKVYGYNNSKMLWNLDDNTPIAENEEYRLVLIYDTAQKAASHDWRINTQTKYTVYEQMTDDEEKKELVVLSEAFDEPDMGITATTNERGLVIRIDDILFDYNSDNFNDDSYQKLGKIIEVLKERYPNREIIIEGHTDNTGSSEYNLDLSKRRAKNVAEHIKLRTANDKISWRGFGEVDPVSSNITEEGRRKNRRVDIIIKMR